MSDLLMGVYNRLPIFARTVAASAMGLYLRQWRYGSRTEALVLNTLERDRWPQANWNQYQHERIRFVLHRAVRKVPYYRDQWARRRREGDQSSWEVLENWPILEKERVRENPGAFVADDCNRRRMFAEHTSGTTGKPVELWWSLSTVRHWYAINEARCRRWYGISRRDRWAIIGGKLVTPVVQRHPPFWIWNSGLNQLYMSAYHLAPDLVPTYLEALKRYRITYLFGYSSALHALAEAALRLGRDDVRLAVVISNAEPLLEHQRSAIARAFRCPVRETYGMAEIVTGASECERGSLHSWPEVGFVELVNDSPDDSRDLRDLVCTGLLNTDMPLIRYRTGDTARISNAPCQCGRTLPIIASLEGRSDDLVITMDGRKVGRLDPIFKGGLPITEAQIVQETFTRIRLRYVAAINCSADIEDQLRTRIQSRLGPVDVVFERVTHVPRSAFGKFRPVISNLTPHERPVVAN